MSGVANYPFIGKVAVTELRAKGLEVRPDDAAMGTEYAKRAYLEFKDAYSYDPFLDKPTLAERAAIEYVKARLRGMNPEGVSEFVAAVQRWTSRAGVAKHKKALGKAKDEGMYPNGHLR